MDWTIIVAIVGWALMFYFAWRNYQVGKSQLLPTLRNLSIHVWDEKHQALTSIEGYKTDNSGKKHKIKMVFYFGFHNMGKANAKPIEAELQWKDKQGNLLPKEDLLEYHLREMTFITGGEKARKWKYITDIMTPDINFHFIEASLRIVYEDSLKKKYCAVQLFHSSNGRIWYKGEYENFKIGFRKKEPTLRLFGGVDKNQKEKLKASSQAN